MALIFVTLSYSSCLGFLYLNPFLGIIFLLLIFLLFKKLYLKPIFYSVYIISFSKIVSYRNQHIPRFCDLSQSPFDNRKKIFCHNCFIWTLFYFPTILLFLGCVESACFLFFYYAFWNYETVYSLRESWNLLGLCEGKCGNCRFLVCWRL